MSMARLPMKGDPVTMGNPTSGKRINGVILDLVTVPNQDEFAEVSAASEGGWLETIYVTLLVKWSDGSEGIWFRYYTRRPGTGPDGWKYAQFAPHMGREEARGLLNRIEQHGWLKQDVAGA
jgi:hypothetical protein